MSTRTAYNRMAGLTSLLIPFSVADCPMVIFLKYLSFVSITLCQVMVEGSMSRRQNLLFSSSDNSSGCTLLISSFFNLSRWIEENVLTPISTEWTHSQHRPAKSGRRTILHWYKSVEQCLISLGRFMEDSCIKSSR